ncbi:MAG: hypothetical protein A3G25_10640 [Betaproteobacteria bacterium RIFCSPLOWO2_12_FULL_63_13]|nr:MAG: hypothetical protein A3G25_10640 [Betaproteobacteria bacterium RIFCSPLOWO2_12_FULL_63_13]
MSEIRAAQVALFYLFDIAETIDLQSVHDLIGRSAVAARLAPKQTTPAYVQYEKPPLSFDGDAVGVGDVEGFRPRFRVYDYGVISVALTRLFDIAETIDLQSVHDLIGRSAVAARLAPKQTTPAYVQYEKPPLSFDGDAVGVGDVEGFRPRFRVYDYGVISVALTRPFSGAWSDLVLLGQTLIENDAFEQRAEGLCRSMADRLRPALKGYREEYLSEDYLVYVVHELERPQSAEELLAARGNDIAAMLRG